MFQSTYFLGFALAISLFAGINAQSSEDVLRFSIVRSSTTTRDSLASETSSIPVETPTGTGQPCAKIAAAAKRHSSQYKVAVPAKVAYDCLTSVPVKRTAALGTIEAVERMAQFQSNLAYLKNPPKDYVNPSVDIMGGLADIRNKVSQNQYRNQYDFEADIGSLLNSARDGHLGFDGPTFVGAVRWRRGAATLVSASLDGGLARIYDRGMSIPAFPRSSPAFHGHAGHGMAVHVSAFSRERLLNFHQSSIGKQRPTSLTSQARFSRAYILFQPRSLLY